MRKPDHDHLVDENARHEMTKTEQQIVDALAEVLGRDDRPLLVSERFDDLGVESLAGLRLAAKLEQSLGAPFDIEWLYDHPNARQLAAFLDSIRGRD